MAVGATEGYFTIQWHITERCNCRCRHCYQEDCSAESDETEIDATLTAINGFLEERRGIITITGGEPLAHPHFFPLLSRLRHPFGVLTNGTLIDQDTARRLVECGPAFVQVSIEGSEKTHEEIRGRGTYRAAVEGIKNLIRLKQRVIISFTAHSRNFRDLPAVARLGRRLGVDKVWVDRLIPAGNGSEIEGLGPQGTRDLFLLMRMSRVAMDRALQFLAGGRPYRCQAGRTLMAITPGGNVMPCRRMPMVAGNLWENTLEEIFQGDLMKDLRDTECEGCSGCLYEKICGGGLRCLAYAHTGSPFQPDPACWIAETLRQKAEGIEPRPVNALIQKRWIWRC